MLGLTPVFPACLLFPFKPSNFISAPPMTNETLLRIVERAASLQERLDEPARAPAATAASPDDARLAAWRQVLGGDEALDTRLALDHLDLPRALGVLGSSVPAPPPALPPWAELLGEVLACAAEPAPAPRSGPSYPFEEILLPFVRVARARAWGAGPAWLSEEAQEAAEQELWRRLSLIAGQTLFLEFSLFLRARSSRLDRLVFRLREGYPSTDNYRAFVESHLASGLRTLFDEYSVLGRLLATRALFWAEALRELGDRLARDHEALAAAFCRPALGQVVAIDPGLSDAHHEGRSVMSLRFRGGLRLIYKPRDCTAEAAFSGFLRWLSAEGLSPDLRAITVLSRDGYGWVEQVEPEAARGEEPARRYFHRQGMLLALLYALRGADCHSENILACGEHPVLVDAEGLLSAPAVQTEADRADPAEEEAAKECFDSVLAVGLLPWWELGAGGRIAYDLSALGGGKGMATPFVRPHWSDLNTDEMSLQWAAARTDEQLGRPLLWGEALPLSESTGHLLWGFESAYRFLEARQQTLLSPEGPLAAFSRGLTRFIFRDSRLYDSLLFRSLAPELMRDGRDRGIALEALAKPLLTRPLWWPLLRHELAALERLDLPHFSARVTETSLPLGPHEQLDGGLLSAGWSATRERIARLGAADLRHQLTLIQGALFSYAVRHDSTEEAAREASSARVDELASMPPEPTSPAALLAEAILLAKELQGRAIEAEDGSLSWIGFRYAPAADRFRLQPLDESLYCGLGGVGLFLAALHRISGDPQHRTTALRVLSPLRRRLEGSGQGAQAMRKSIGGGDGLGSVVYSLVKASQWLDEPSLLESATQIAAFLTPAAIESDQTFDVLGGAAGTILGLLRLHEATQDKRALALAIACGHHLVQARSRASSGHLVWKSMPAEPFSGFSHGAAGIAFALLQLHRVAEQASFLDAAREAIAYEQAVYLPVLEAAIQDKNTPSRAGTWCHGIAGMALVRRAHLDLLDSPQTRREMQLAEDIQLTDRPRLTDHLCCGDLGRVELLLAAGALSSRPEMLPLARRVAGGAMQRARRAGSYRLFAAGASEIFDPGLFLGLSGVGFSLLRAAYPDRLSSILLWG